MAASRFLDNTPEKKVRLEDGREIIVPSDLLEPQRDGSFYLHSPGEGATPEVRQQAQTYSEASASAQPPDRPRGKGPASSPQQNAPMPRNESPRSDGPRPEPPRADAPRADVATSPISSSPESVQLPSNEPLFREDCEIERVAIRKLLDRPAETRQEGDTLIVPLMEEVWVVEKRLLLREELHITRRKNQIADSHTRAVRREDLEKAG